MILKFKYKPMQYFIDSANYDVEWDKTRTLTWSSLVDFDTSEIGEETLDLSHIHIEIKYDIVETNNEL